MGFDALPVDGTLTGEPQFDSEAPVAAAAENSQIVTVLTVGGVRPSRCRTAACVAAALMAMLRVMTVNGELALGVAAHGDKVMPSDAIWLAETACGAAKSPAISLPIQVGVGVGDAHVIDDVHVPPLLHLHASRVPWKFLERKFLTISKRQESFG